MRKLLSAALIIFISVCSFSQVAFPNLGYYCPPVVLNAWWDSQNKTLGLYFDTVVGYHYDLQSSSNLTDWVSVTNFVASFDYLEEKSISKTFGIIIPNNPPRNMFFRVKYDCGQ